MLICGYSTVQNILEGFLKRFMTLPLLKTHRNVLNSTNLCPSTLQLGLGQVNSEPDL